MSADTATQWTAPEVERPSGSLVALQAEMQSGA